MRWTGYNPRVMKRDEPVSEQGEHIVQTARGKPALGIAPQVRAIRAFIDALDRAINTLNDAGNQRDERVSSAQGQFEQGTTKHDERLERAREEIATQSKAAEQGALAKHEQKLAELRAHRDKAIGIIQQRHKGVIEKAKRDAQERVWMADTMLESESLKLEQRRKSDEKAIEDRVKLIDSYEETLGGALSHSVMKSLASIADAPVPDREMVTLDRVDSAISALSEAVEVCRGSGLGGMLRGKATKIEQANAANLALHTARATLQEYELKRGMELDSLKNALNDRYRAEVSKAEHTAMAYSKDSERKAGASIREENERHDASVAERESKRDAELAEIQRWVEHQTRTAESNHEDATRDARELHDKVRADAHAEYERVYSATQSELDPIVRESMRVIGANRTLADDRNPEWALMPEGDQPNRVPGVVRFSSMRIDLLDRLGRLPESIRETIDIPDSIQTPGVLALPGPSSFVIRHDRDSREAALGTMRNVITRILASFPGRKARFVLCDPIGIGQSFAGFMRLSDLDPSPVGQRIWADPNQIERQLVDLTEHMQTVIQKYLRKDYATIEEYNDAAGEIAEPYRFIVIPDLQVALTDNGASKLKSILESGPRCGVYAILCAEHKSKLPEELRGSLDDVPATLHLGEKHDPFAHIKRDEMALALDAEPDDALFGQILDRVARASEDAGRIEVPFDRLTPTNASELWSRDCADELVVPLGRSGARKVQELRLGLGTRQHALIAGRTGSGKSTLLHVMITAAGMWYGPDQLEMYLIDFKKGVEFKAYTGGRLPHVRAVAIESDREFGLSVLQRLDDELTTRGELFRKLGAQDLAGARKLAPDEHLPRVLLLIDEFQEFFTIDDEVASNASLLLDRLVRQGRAFGVHVILGSQTLSGAYSLARSTLGQIGVRIALQCSEADSYLILGEDNNAARLLERPGEAIYNNAGGLIEGNSPFQTAWLPDSDRDAALNRLPAPTIELEPTVVFEGNTLAKFDATRVAFEHANPDRSIPRTLLGESVAIAPPVAPMFTKRSGGNMLVVGPQTTSAQGMLASSAITFAATPNSKVVIIDATPEEDPDYTRIEHAIDGRGDNIELHRANDATRVVSEINEIVRSRSGHPGDPVLLIIAGLHRLRDLRKSEDFGFSLDDDGGSSPDKDLAHVLLEGPVLGVWTLAWCDTLTNLDRTFDRGTIREFGMRVLMQMSASDSTMLMDSSAASNLGANRALLTDDVEGTEIKFRPVQAPGASHEL